MNQENIDRINFLYNKSKAEGLTDEERDEQAVLRGEYIASVRANLRGTLNTIKIQNPDGTLVDLKEKHGTEKFEM